MTKHWGGGSGGAFACCSEMFNASTHVLDFPKDATPRQKAALVGATLLIVSFKMINETLKNMAKGLQKTTSLLKICFLGFCVLPVLE